MYKQMQKKLKPNKPKKQVVRDVVGISQGK
jgi:hypothetical protein